jgi:hypothetical protein
LCDAISASAGLSLSVGTKYWDQNFMQPGNEAVPPALRKFICAIHRRCD